MNNGAFITLEHDSSGRGVYFYNSLGHGFVQVAIEETRRRFRFTRDSDLNTQNEIDTFYTVLYGVIREYQLYYYYSNKNFERHCPKVFLCNRNDKKYFNNVTDIFVVDTDFFSDQITGVYNDLELSIIDKVRAFYDSTHIKLRKSNELPSTAKELYTDLVIKLNSVDSSNATYFMIEEDARFMIIGYFTNSEVESCVPYIELYINEYVSQNSSKVTDIKPWNFKYTFS